MALNVMGTRQRAAKALKANGGKARSGEIRINVSPASFTAKDGTTVIGTRVGKHFLVPEHVLAILDYLKVDAATVDQDRFDSMFGA
jgi:hypothetical protein